MKFFIDTANVDEIKQAADMGLLDGVTTYFEAVDYEATGLLQMAFDLRAYVNAYRLIWSVRCCANGP